MSDLRRKAIDETLQNAGVAPRLARELAPTIDNAIDNKGTKEILETIRDVQNRLERIEKRLKPER